MRLSSIACASIFSLLLGLSGCELSGEVAPPAAATLHVAVAEKLLRFTWDPADGASSYRLLADLDGTGFAPVSDELHATSYDLELAVHRLDWPAARFQVRACNVLGCTDSNAVDVAGGMLAAIGYLKAWNAGSGHRFGLAVSLSANGSTLAVGAPGESSSSSGVNPASSDGLAPDSGAVYVFRHGSAGWALEAYLKASDPELGAAFGWAVSLGADGSSLAVGAPHAGTGPGAAYVFTRGDAGWQEQARLTASAAQPGDQLGFAVSLGADGGSLAAGAPYASSGAGAAYLFTHSDAGWQEQARLTASAALPGDQLGFAVSLSADGGSLAVGAPYAGSGAGAAYLFARGDGGWQEQAHLAASVAQPDGQLGWAVSLGADGGSLAVGAPNASLVDRAVPSAGAVFLFTRVDGSYELATIFDASNPAAGDRFGVAVALSADGSTLVVGADEEDGAAAGVGGDEADDSAADSGAVYVFARVEAAWARQAYVKAWNPGAGDAFGGAVSLSASGSSLAVGAMREDSGLCGTGGERREDDSLGDAGAVYLY